MKYTSLIMVLLVAGITGCTNIRPIGKVNGVQITRVTTRGVFSPSSTTLIGSNPEKPGEIEVLANASGPGFIPAVAQAGGIAGGAALLRPARSNTSVNTSVNSSAIGTGNGGNGGSSVGGGDTTQNGSVHHNTGNGNGSGNNGNQ